MPDTSGFTGLPPGMPNPEAIFESWWPIIIALVGGLLYGIRQYFRGARCTSEIKLDGKVAIVTGGYTGIGKYIVEDFAKRGAKVYIGCRDTTAGEEVAKEMAVRTRNKNIHCLPLDLCSFKSVQAFVDAFKKKEEKLNYLINNAGVMMCPLNMTDDKFEEQIQVNYLSHVLLTHLLFPMLQLSEPARIVNTSAAAYRLGSLDLEDINFEKKEYSANEAYAQSKLAVTMFTRIFAKKFPLEDSGVTVNAVLPGVVNTGIHRHMPFRKSTFINVSMSPVLWYLMKHPEDGAQVTIFCCLAEALAGVSGELYTDCAKTKYDEITDSEELQEQLWTKTLEWLDIKQFGKQDS